MKKRGLLLLSASIIFGTTLISCNNNDTPSLKEETVVVKLSSNIRNGKVNIKTDLANIKLNDEIILEFIPDNGYELTSIDINNELIKLDNPKEYKFNIKENVTTISATFSKILIEEDVPAFIRDFKFVGNNKNEAAITEYTLVEYRPTGPNMPNRCEIPSTYKGKPVTRIETVVDNVSYRGFSSAGGIKEVVIPSSIKFIDFRAFNTINTIESFEFIDSENYLYEDGSIYNLDKTTLYTVTNIFNNKTYKCIDSVTTINDYAFFNKKILNYDLNNVTTIKSYAFKEASVVTEITLNDNVTSIEEGTFSGITTLSSIKLSNNITKLPKKTLEKCPELETIIFPAKLESVGAYCFEGSNKIRTLDFTNTNLKTLENDSLIGMMLIEEIKLGSKLEVIGNSVFTSSQKLQEIILPESLKSIGDKAFESCLSLSSINIPKNVEHIGINPFYICTGLKNITVDSENAHFEILDHSLVTKSNEEKALITFPLCTILPSDKTEYTIPTGIKVIKDRAFAYLQADGVAEKSNVSRVIIPKEVTTIELAFIGSNLRNVSYQGTKNEFTTVNEKLASYNGQPVYWNFQSSIYSVKCTDGDYSVMNQIGSEE